MGLTNIYGGRLSDMVLPRGSITYGYDGVTGNLSFITAPDGGGLGFTYDGSLLLDSTWTGSVAGSVERSYDNDFRVTSESINGANLINFTYDNDGLLTQSGGLVLTRDLQNGLISGSTQGAITESMAYNTFGEVISRIVQSNGVDIFTEQLTRDKLGRITQKTVSTPGQTNNHGYVYDQAGRLTDVTLGGSAVARYGYGQNSNRVSKTTPTGTLSGSYDAQDRLVTYGNNSYSYNANGDLTSKTNSVSGGTTSYKNGVLVILTSVCIPSGKIYFVVFRYPG